MNMFCVLLHANCYGGFEFFALAPHTWFRSNGRKGKSSKRGNNQSAWMATPLVWGFRFRIWVSPGRHTARMEELVNRAFADCAAAARFLASDCPKWRGDNSM